MVSNTPDKPFKLANFYDIEPYFTKRVENSTFAPAHSVQHIEITLTF